MVGSEKALRQSWIRTGTALSLTQHCTRQHWVLQTLSQTALSLAKHCPRQRWVKPNAAQNRYNARTIFTTYLATIYCILQCMKSTKPKIFSVLQYNILRRTVLVILYAYDTYCTVCIHCTVHIYILIYIPSIIQE